VAIPRGTLKPTSDGIRNTSTTPSPAGVNGRGGQNTGDAVAHQQPARAEGVTDRADAAPQRGGVQQPQGGDPFHHRSSGPAGAFTRSAARAVHRSPQCCGQFGERRTAMQATALTAGVGRLAVSTRSGPTLTV